MLRRWSVRILLVLIALPPLVRCYDRSLVIKWVGGTDLEVEFVVTDAESGDPIPNAQVKIHSEGGVYSERDVQDFVLVANQDGKVRKECAESMCFGSQSRLGLIDTFAVHLPWWYFWVVAEGYESSAPIELDVPENIRQARRVGPGKAKLVVPVSLRALPVP